MTMKILITGKSSRIGQAFIEHMKSNHPDEMEICTISLRGDEWRGSDWSGYDAVLHLVGVTVGNAELFFSVNRDLAAEVAHKAKSEKIPYFVYASTMMVYGESAPIGRSFTIDRNTTPSPVSNYGRSKYEGEEAIINLSDPQFSVAIVREPVVYGEHFDGEFQKLLALSDMIPLFPTINSSKSYIYEGNLSECFRQLILNRRSGVFCPQNSEQPTTSELFQLMRETVGKKTIRLKGLQPVLSLLSHATKYVNAVFNDMKYTPELSRIDGLNYCVYSLKETIVRCRK